MFLREVAGLCVSDIAGPRDSPENAFLRCNTLHHDIVPEHEPELDGTSFTTSRGGSTASNA